MITSHFSNTSSWYLRQHQISVPLNLLCYSVWLSHYNDKQTGLQCSWCPLHITVCTIKCACGSEVWFSGVFQETIAQQHDSHSLSIHSRTNVFFNTLAFVLLQNDFLNADTEISCVYPLKLEKHRRLERLWSEQTDSLAVLSSGQLKLTVPRAPAFVWVKEVSVLPLRGMRWVSC